MNSALLAEYGSFLAEAGFLDEALIHLHKAVEFDPRQSASIECLAKVYTATGDRAEAERQWGAVLTLGGLPAAKREMAFIELARLRLDDGEQASAAELLRGASQLNPRDRSILEQRRTVLKGLGPAYAGEFEEVCRVLLGQEPSDKVGWGVLAEHYLQVGRMQEALAAFESLLNVDAGNPRASFYLGVAAHDAARQSGGDLTHARSLLEKSIKGAGRISREELSLARLLFCDICQSTGREAKSGREALENVEDELLPEERWSLFALCAERAGGDLLDGRMNPRAISWLGRALRKERTPERASMLAHAYAVQADGLRQEGKLGKALRCCETGLAEVPGAASILAVRHRIQSSGVRRVWMFAGGAAAVIAAGILAVIFSRGDLRIEVPAGTRINVQDPVGRPVRLKESPSVVVAARIVPGSYSLDLRRAGYYDWDSVVVVRGGRTTQVLPAMRAGFAHWIVRTWPRARLVIDGRDCGLTPREIPRFPMGSHKIELIAPFFRQRTETVAVEPGQAVVRRVTLVGLVEGNWQPAQGDEFWFREGEIWKLQQQGNRVSGHVQPAGDDRTWRWMQVSGSVEPTGRVRLRATSTDGGLTNVWFFAGLADPLGLEIRGQIDGGEGISASNAPKGSPWHLRLLQ